MKKERPTIEEGVKRFAVGKVSVSRWKKMKETDSRECRNCHDEDAMDFLEQRRRSVKQHIKGFDENKTCIDCHKGIAHSLPTMYEDDPQAALLDKREK